MYVHNSHSFIIPIIFTNKFFLKKNPTKKMFYVTTRKKDISYYNIKYKPTICDD